MTDKLQQKFLSWAEAFDAWRVFPRIFISTYIYLLYKSITWFMALSTPTVEQAGLISIVTGVGAMWFNSYVNSSKKFKLDKTED